MYCPMETRIIMMNSQIDCSRENNGNNIAINTCENDKIENVSIKDKNLKEKSYEYYINIINNKKFINPNNGQNLCNSVKEIDICFLFNDKKELYLTVNSSQIFEEVEKMLREKYNWINSFTGISYYYNNLLINDKTKTMNEFGIKNDDTILIEAK